MHLAVYLVAILSIGFGNGSLMPPPVDHHEHLKFEANTQDTRADDEWRLPQDVLPVSYNVRLLPFFEDRNFLTQGRVEIIVNCVQATSSITFNYLDMTIDRQSITVVRRDNDLSVSVTDVIETPAYQKITLVTGTPLGQGFQYVVSMNFTYFLSIPLNGFFRTSYVQNGVTKWMAATQFEAPNARKAFPCFDDPGMKAVFYITLGRRTTWTALANTPVQQTIPIPEEPGYVWDIFQPSVKMSTYLNAFVVSELNSVTSDAALSNVQFRIWARPEAMNQTAYAADVGPRISEFFESFFEVDFPLPKQDMAAVPRYGGAMENWGLIIYGESNLLYDPTFNTAAYKYSVAEVIAHELAHQWTGNWVTCKWWNVIWLNEGFAQLMQYYGADGAAPEFKAFEQFPVRTFQPTLISDSAPTRPINQPVSSPAESSAMFDTITYSKGACIIRMMADFLGDETFRLGMKLYLTRMAYGSAEQDDLFTALNDQATVNSVNLPASVKTIMDTWTFQMGYPLITITRNYGSGNAVVTQERFLRVQSNDTTVYKWWVPITYRTTSSSGTSAVWLSELSATVNFGATTNQWVLANIDQKGYYRVKYDTINYGLIRDQLVANPETVSVNNRAQLLDDAFNLALLGRINYTDAFDMTLYLAKERSYSPWHGVLPELDYINSMFLNDPSFGDWKRYMSERVAPYFSFIGFNENANDEYLTILSRSNAVNWACKLGVPECASNATAAFASWSTSPANVEVISRNQKTIILCSGIQYGTEANWEYAFQRFLNPQDPNERGVILNALTCTGTLGLQTRLLELMINRTNGITTSDGVSFFNGLANNPAGNRVAFDFLRNRWNDLARDYSGSLASFYRTISTRYNTDLQLEQLLALRNEHMDVLGSSPTADLAIATVQDNIKWMNTNAQVIVSWLKGH